MATLMLLSRNGHMKMGVRGVVEAPLSEEVDKGPETVRYGRRKLEEREVTLRPVLGCI
jgi:hypothetical protein